MSKDVRRFPLLLFTLCSCFLSVHAAAAQSPASPQESAQPAIWRIAGTIVNALDGSPLDKARVSLSEARARTNPSFIVTSENGHFEFSGLGAGKFSLQGAKRGFLSAAYDQHEQYSTAIVTGAGLDTEHLVLRLTPLAWLSGTVLDESGDPVRHAQVLLYRQNRDGGVNRISGAGNSSTDDRGYYEFPTVAPGDYFVSVEAKPWYAVHPASLTTEGTPNRASVQPSLDVAYPTTYYNGATEADQATSIAVKPADHVQVDLQLNPVPALHLFFRVPADQQGFTPPVFQKRVFDSQHYVQSEAVQGVSSGVYEVAGIPPGKYIVQHNDPKTGRPARSAEMELSVNTQQLEDNLGDLAGSAKLTVQLPRGEKPPKQFGVLLLDSRGQAQGEPLGADGTAVFESLPPGKYTVLVSSPNRAFSVASFLSNGVASKTHDLIVAPGASLDVTLFLTEGVTTIEGFTKREGKPVAGVMVILIPSDPEIRQGLFRRDQSDLDGSFVLRGVVPGTYTIVAVEDAWGFPWQQPDVLARYMKRGQNVTVSDIMSGSVRLSDPVTVQSR